MEINKIKDSTESIQCEAKIKNQAQKEFKLIGSTRKIPGHTLFSFNTKTKEIKAVETTVKEPVINSYKRVITSRKHKLQIEPDCIYRQALNKNNLIKKLIKEGIVVKT